METEEILRELDTIFRDILKNENIALTPATTSKDVEGWYSLDVYKRHTRLSYWKEPEASRKSTCGKETSPT